MSNRYIGIKTETWFEIKKDLSGKWYKYILVIETSLWATKGWKYANKKRYKTLVSYYESFPRKGYSVSFSRSG